MVPRVFYILYFRCGYTWECEVVGMAKSEHDQCSVPRLQLESLVTIMYMAVCIAIG